MNEIPSGSPQPLPLPQPINWFEYRVRVQPHHTDYAGVVWHGSYLTWLEEARIAALRTTGIEFADLVALGCDLPVVELSLQYQQPLRMGAIALVKSRITAIRRVRIYWEQIVEDAETQAQCVTALLTLVPFDRQTNRIVRKLPPRLSQAFTQLGIE